MWPSLIWYVRFIWGQFIMIATLLQKYNLHIQPVVKKYLKIDQVEILVKGSIVWSFEIFYKVVFFILV